MGNTKLWNVLNKVIKWPFCSSILWTWENTYCLNRRDAGALVGTAGDIKRIDIGTVNKIQRRGLRTLDSGPGLEYSFDVVLFYWYSGLSYFGNDSSLTAYRLLGRMTQRENNCSRYCVCFLFVVRIGTEGVRLGRRCRKLVPLQNHFYSIFRREIFGLGRSKGNDLFIWIPPLLV